MGHLIRWSIYSEKGLHMQTHIILTSDYSKVYRELTSKGAVTQGPFLRLRRQVSAPPPAFYRDYLESPNLGAAPVTVETHDMRLYPLWIMDLLGGSAYNTATQLETDCVIIHRLNRAQLRQTIPPSTWDTMMTRIIGLTNAEPRRLIGGPVF